MHGCASPQAGGFGIYAHPSKRTRFTHGDDGAGASSAAFASLEPSLATQHQQPFSKLDEPHIRAGAAPQQKVRDGHARTVAGSRG